jgi:hypothetical protein
MADIWESFLKLRELNKESEPFGKQIYNTHYQRILLNKKETMIRFITKAMIGKILFDEKKSFITEWQKRIENKIIDQYPVVNLDDNYVIKFNEQESNTCFKLGNFKIKKINIQELHINLQNLKDFEEKIKEKLE